MGRRAKVSLAAIIAACGVTALCVAGAPSAAAGGLGPTCPGDCNRDGQVLVNELIIGVNIALGLAPITTCPEFDLDGDGTVVVNELVSAVLAALTGAGCPDSLTPTVAPPTGTATSVAETTLTPTETRTTAPTETVAAATPTGTAAATVTETPIATPTGSAIAQPTDTPPIGTPTGTATATSTASEEATQTPAVATPTGTTGATVTPVPDASPTTTPSPTSIEPSATPTPIATPSALSAVVQDDLVLLSWIPPPPAAGQPFARVLRRLNAAVSGPDDPAATPIFFGEAEDTTDAVPNLLPDTAAVPRTYHYAVYACTAEQDCEPQGAAATLTLSLVQALRAGGYTLHWRHSAATICADQLCAGTAAAPVIADWWKSCDAVCPPHQGSPEPGMCPTHDGTSTARQLNQAGVAEAIAIGEAFRALAIPIGRVLSSEYCRNVQTAELMDFGPTIELVPGLTYYVYDEVNRCQHVSDLIDEVPPVGSNTAIIGHAALIPPGGDTTCGILNTLEWSEVAIFKPDGAGGNTYITRLMWDRWPELASTEAGGPP